MSRAGVKRAFAAAVLIASASIGACTVFDGLSADAPGTDAAAEASGDAGPDSGPVPAGYLSLEEAARFCTNAIKCPLLGGSTLTSIGVPVDVLNYTACINWLAGPLPPDRLGVTEARAALRCAASATTCQGAGSCMWYELITANDPRCSGFDASPERACAEDGGAVYLCGSGGVIYHCGGSFYPPGTTCLQGADKVRWCALAKNCSIQTMCQGGYLEYCGAGSNLLTGSNCTTGGMTCGFDTASSSTDCLTNGVLKSCSTTSVMCSGNLVSVCDGLYTTIFNCGALNGTCDGLGLPYCKLPNATCTPDLLANKCTGDVVSLCVGGQPATLDCTKLGMKCVPAGNGASPHCE